MPCPMPYSPISRVLSSSPRPRHRAVATASSSPASSSLWEQTCAGRRELLRPHHDPLAVLHLLDLGQIVAVVVRPVEAKPPADLLALVLSDPPRHPLP